ncbi:uncharacterized protein GVI51_H04433 [Nakaseomyces glabratus]|uniref:Serine/threonine-protein kinase TEL1 n=1 Tax=Candida glabrata (strain ATCC 2001 / BCRC 20586 / JCM 3761 / NBRC 0622 / NRRL Y-65 / CBS 138) TaxID=284593 RepID=ATM_CANGA|nr:uncharacterized protein CAGL0H04609g [Nakaseomyces glabratus]Q6FRZ9.1 RecName: Full=Serine/threonine-protein kinase TEL1; AltName: Full=ATM homolog; AltName: Full=DNA-damage checkpoint kinase TEL1; AltName: Full=Telomere length regulation protein 1 [Nakaseomyces glabratus CBS 138]KAH7601421.1 Phosphatidylinositol 3- and 4-kinases family profile [Nakaseomyces glabratus]QHS66634.1 uncharacterized protein GVI51_H04433 [Nakaseomyces glabratus]CAG59928.1 unnamed protein product [Nakaseomyces glab|eukprot:XP_446995.1 uncharacterized protein CAGL0H04609g [[Candida] glabrata]
MENYQIRTLQDQLTSSKLRDRNAGLQELQSILKDNPGFIANEQINGLLNTLLSLLENEAGKYIDSIEDDTDSRQRKENISISRFSNITYTLRLFIETVIEKFKLSHLKLTISAVKDLFYNDARIIVPVINDVTYCILAIVKSEIFGNKIGPSQWLDVAEYTLWLIKITSSNRSNIRALTNSLDTFYVLLIKGSISLSKVAKEALVIITNLIVFEKGETATTNVLLSISSNLVARLHCQHYYDTTSLIIECWKLYTRIGKTNNFNLLNDISKIDIFGGGLLQNQIPIMPGQEIMGSRISHSVVLSTLQDYIPMKVKEMLDVDHSLTIGIYDDLNNSNMDLTYNTFAKTHCKDLAWLRLFGLYDTLCLYYRLSNQERENNATQILKKIKYEGSLQSNLNQCNSLLDYSQSLLESGDPLIQLLGCKLFFLLNLDHPIACNTELIDRLCINTNNISLTSWHLACIFTNISYDLWNFDETLYLKVLKYITPLLSTSEVNIMACLIFNKLLHSLTREPIDELSSLVNSIIASPDSVLPIEISSVTCEAWQHIFVFAINNLKVDNSLLLDSFSKWINHNITQTIHIEHLKLIFEFFLWSLDVVVGSTSHNKQHNTYNLLNLKTSDSALAIWYFYENQRKFLTQTIQTSSQASVNTKSMVCPITSTNIKIQWLLNIIDNYFTTSKNHSLKYTFAISLIYFINFIEKSGKVYTYLNQELNQRLNSILIELDFLSFDKWEEGKQFIEIICNQETFFNRLHNDVVFKDNILLSLINLFEKEYSHFLNADNGSTAKTGNDIYLNQRSILRFRTDIKLMTQFFTCVDSNVPGKIGIYLDRLLLYSMGPNESLVLDELLSWVTNPSNNQYYEVHSLEKLCQFLAKSLLNSKYQLSDFSMIRLGLFLTSTIELWVNVKYNILNSDCNDFLIWITNNLVQNNFGETGTFVVLIRLFISVLKHNSTVNSSCAIKTQDLYSMLIFCMRNVAYSTLGNIVDELKAYMSKKSHKNRKTILDDLVELFEPMPESVEKAASSCFVLFGLLDCNDTNFVYTLDIFSNYGNIPHISFFLKKAVKNYVNNYYQGNKIQLLNVHILEVIRQWTKRNDTDRQLYFNSVIGSLFGFGSIQEFERQYNREICALIFSRSDSESLERNFFSDRNTSKCEMLRRSLYLLIPLSYYDNGVGDMVFNKLKDSFRGQLESVLSSNFIIVMRYALKLCDCSDYTSVLNEMQRPNQSSSLLELFMDSEMKNAINRMNIYITVHSVIKIFKNCGRSRQTLLLDLRTLILWIISDIQKSESSWEQNNHLRQLQLLVFLYEDTFLQSVLHIELMNWLSYLLKIENIEADVFLLLNCLLSLIKPNSLDKPDSLTLFFLNVLHFYVRNKECLKIGDEDMNMLSNNLSTVNSIALKLLTNGQVTDLIYNQVGDLTSQMYFAEEVELFALLMTFAPPMPDYVSHKMNKKFIEYVYKSNNLIDIDNFSLWFSDYSTQYSSLILELEENSSFCEKDGFGIDDMEIVYDFSDSAVSAMYSVLFRSLISIKPTIGFKSFALSNIICHLISINILKDKDLLSKFLRATKMKIAFSAKEIDETIIEHFGKSNCGCVISEHYLESEFFDTNIPYKDWLVKLCMFFISQISLNSKEIQWFIPLCYESMDFCKQNVCIFFLAAFSFDHRRMSSTWKHIFSRLNDLTMASDCLAKLTLLLSFIRLIRSGALQGRKEYSNLYQKIEFKGVIDAALKIKDSKFALQLFEEAYMCENGDYDVALLTSIYEQLDDVDMLYALPTPISLNGFIKNANRLSPHSLKALQLNGAYFDANFNHLVDNGSHQLVNTLTGMGFNALADIADLRTSCDNPADAYLRCLQLDKWDLPKPKAIDCKIVSFYNTAYDLRNTNIEFVDLLQNAEIQLYKAKANFSSKLEWFETIREYVKTKRAIISLKTDTDISRFKIDHVINPDRYLENALISDIKINWQFRYLMLKIYVEREKFANEAMKCIPILELIHQTELSVDFHIQQTSLSRILSMEAAMKRFHIADTNLVEQLSRHVSYVTALALREFGETKAPLTILSKLLSDKSYKLNYNTFVSDDEVRAQLIWDSYQAKVKSGIQIFENDVEHWDVSINNIRSAPDTIYKVANFLNLEISRLNGSDQLKEKQKSYRRTRQELKDIESVVKSSNLSNEELLVGQKHYHNLKTHMENDRLAIENICLTRKKLIKRALDYYVQILILTNNYDYDVLDRFCGLWFENDDDDDINTDLTSKLSQIPTWKFLPWVNQFTSKLSLLKSKFQKQLWYIMKRLLYKLPFETGYAVINLQLYEKYSDKLDEKISEKIKAANLIFDQLQNSQISVKEGEYLRTIQEFCYATLEIAELKVKGKNAQISLETLNIGRYWITELPKKNLPLPTVTRTINSSQYTLDSSRNIVKVIGNITITSTGLSLPKVMTLLLSDGSRHKVVIKYGSDDLRQDAIMEQVFQQVNKIFGKDVEMRRSDLHMRTYNVVPLGPKAGLIEFVNNSLSLHSILTDIHKDDNYSWLEARRSMKDVQSKSDKERILTYLDITKKISPKFRNFFFNSFIDANGWICAKRKYTKGVATSSMVGYILGLGDRHLNNILIDTTTGEPIHIDLGIAFDQGRLLKIPELVPFRLTRDIIDGFGITGVEGIFRRTCEQVLNVLSRDSEKVMCVLNILKWDPLYSWAVSPFKKHKYMYDDNLEGHMTTATNNSKVIERKLTPKLDSDENQQSYRALKGVQEKLDRNGLTIEATVEKLIQEAVDESNLALIFNGWSPFY